MKRSYCRICGTDAAEKLFTAIDTNWEVPGEFDIVRCSACGFVFVGNPPADAELAKYYPDIYYIRPYAGVLDELEAKRLNSIFHSRYALVKKFKTCGSLLDVGSGDGLFLAYAKENGWSGKLAGVETSKAACDFAKRWPYLEINNGDLLNLKLETSSCDAITMWEVLEHLTKLNENLQEVKRLLKDDGIFAGSVPNFNSLERFMFGKHWTFLDAPRHLYNFTSDSLKRLLEKNGFTDVKFFYSLIHLKNGPMWGYSDSLRCFLRSHKLYQGKRTILEYEAEGRKNPSMDKRTFIQDLLIRSAHLVEYAVFSILELASFPFKATETIYFVAKKR